MESVIPLSKKAINLTSWNTELDFAESDLHSSREVLDANSPTTWTHPDLSKPLKNGQKNGIKMCEDARSKSWL